MLTRNNDVLEEVAPCPRASWRPGATSSCTVQYAAQHAHSRSTPADYPSPAGRYILEAPILLLQRLPASPGITHCHSCPEPQARLMPSPPLALAAAQCMPYWRAGPLQTPGWAVGIYATCGLHRRLRCATV